MSTQRQAWACSFPYFLDILNSTIFNTPVPFTTRYPSLHHYSLILADQQALQSVVYRMISMETKGEQELDIHKLIEQSGYNEECCNQIMQVLKAKYNEYKKQIIKKQVSLGGWHYLGLNWKIKSVVGCSQFTHKMKVVVKLDIGVGRGKAEDQVQTISLELGIPELRQLLNKLKQISKDMKSSAF